jgi:hypothetical protein
LTLAKLGDLKQDIEERDEQIKELKAQVQHMNDYSQGLDA